ncbi:deoxynucleotidyltransferase terminal-interacting protein 2 isoform X2 [Pseudophryne corroboree]
MGDVKQIVTRSRRSSGQSNADVSEAESTSSNPTTRITRSRQSLGHLANSPRSLRSRQSTLITEPIIESIEGELSEAESNCSSVSTRAKRRPPRRASRLISRSQKSGLISESISDHSEAESHCSSISGVHCIGTKSAKKTSVKYPASPIVEYQQKEISDNESCSSGYTLKPIPKRSSRRIECQLQSGVTVSGDLTTVAQQNILSSPRRSSRNQSVNQKNNKVVSVSESQSKEVSDKYECVNETNRDRNQEHETIKKQMSYLHNLTASEDLSTVTQQILSSPRRSLRNQPVHQKDDGKAFSANESPSKEVSDKVSGEEECVTKNSRDSSPEQETLKKQKPSLVGVTVSGELSPRARRNIVSPPRGSLQNYSVSQSDVVTEASVSDSPSKGNLNKVSAIEQPEENDMPIREEVVELPVEVKAASVTKLCVSQPTEKENVRDQIIDLTEDLVDEEQIQSIDDDDDDDDTDNVTKNKDIFLNLDSNSETGEDERIEEDSEMGDGEVIEIEAKENNTPLVKKGHLQKASTQPLPDVVEDGLFVIDKAPGLDSSKKYYVDPKEGHLEVENEESENENLSEIDDDDDFIDEDEDELLNRPKRGFVLSTSIDTGINIKKMGGLYINFDAEKPNPGPSFLDKLKKESKKKDELLQKSIITPDFEKKETVPPYTESLNKFKKQRKEEREKTTGCGWFDMKAPEMTAELKNDLKALKMRSAMDPKHFYKKNDRDGFPKYFQVGTVVDNPVDYYHSRIPKKQRKRTIVEELLADSEFRRYNKKKYQEIIAEKAARAEGKKKRKKKKFHT